MSKPPTRPTGWLPHPALSVVLAALWLVLQQSVAVPNLITAALLGLLLPRVLAPFLGPPSHPRNWGVIVRFTGIVLWDIVMSNIAVAKLVLAPAGRPKPAWVPIELDVQHPMAIALLAIIITTTPGTVSCVVDDETGNILVHALDCDDAAEMAQQIKQRYEWPLRQIFEGAVA